MHDTIKGWDLLSATQYDTPAISQGIHHPP